MLASASYKVTILIPEFLHRNLVVIGIAVFLVVHCKEIPLARDGAVFRSAMGLALEYRWQWTLYT